MHPMFGRAFLSVLCSSVVACGGGSDGDAPSSSTSETQRNFEDAVLTSKGGGEHRVAFGFGPGASGSPAVLLSAIVYKMELAGSPAESGTPTTATVASYDLVTAVPAPARSNPADDRVGTAFIDAGQIRFYGSGSQPRVGYAGDDVIVEFTAPTGEVGSRVRISSYGKVPLTGRFVDAPAEFIEMNNLLNAQIRKPDATFAAGAAYYVRRSTLVGDHVVLTDADFDFTTDPKSATPLFTGTIEQYAASAPTLLELARGSIRTVKGARCWVNTTPGAPDGPQGTSLSNATTTVYGAFCEVNGKLYQAQLQADGGELGTIYPAAGASFSLQRKPFVMRFNKAAVDSLKAMTN
jgi:hypothetical protein